MAEKNAPKRNGKADNDILWQQTMCILCATNCGIEVQIQDRHFIKIRGDKAHPVSKGYLCQKAARLDHYQNHLRRVKHPLKRMADGSYERIDWDTAVSEITSKLQQIRQDHGGHAIAYYGGGGQGNHLPGVHAAAFRAALDTPFYYSALAQEKTGDFWVNGKLFGRQTCHVTEGIHESDYVILIGTNPWQSHGFPRARKVLQQISKDPKRTLVVIDPRRTKTAQMADVHMAVKPGADAFLLTAMLAVIVQEGLEDSTFIAKRTANYEPLRDHLLGIDVADYAAQAEIDEAIVRDVARGFAQAKRGCTRHDLGVEQSLHSTLNTYLEKLLFLLTGNFGREGTNNLHTQFAPVIGHSKEPELGGITSKVTGMKEISRIYPPNLLPLEINTNHPDRVRALFIDSGNPMQSGANSQAYRDAAEMLDLLVVIDVAMTESAECADYVLPAATQYEKWEAAFFTFMFPDNYFYLRRPILEPDGDTLPEPEIYRRLMVAMGAIPDSFPELEKYARDHRANPELGIFPVAFQQTMMQNPEWQRYAAIILYATLGKALPDGAQSAAVLWGTSNFYAQRYKKQVRRAGYEGKGHMLAEDLFEKILTVDTAVPISLHTYDEGWELIRHKDGKIHLAIDEMLAEMRDLEDEKEMTNEEFPLVLAAGERRDYNANQIMRSPDWRRKDRDGALRIHPEDAVEAEVTDGEEAICQTETGTIKVLIAYDKAQRRGFVSLPHGYGMEYPDLETEELVQVGPRVNELTSSLHCDPIAKTPYHKYIPVKIRPFAG